MHTEKLSFSKVNTRMKPQRYPYTLESLQRWAKWRQRGIPNLSLLKLISLTLCEPVYLAGTDPTSSLSFPDTTGRSTAPLQPSSANPVSINSPGMPVVRADSSKTSTMTPPSMTPPSQSIAGMLSGWMEDGASGDTGRSGVAAARDGEPWGTCDWGYCNRVSVAWRLDDRTGRMLTVCALHMDVEGSVALVCHGAAAWLCTIGHGHVCA